jgi:hypothetical protein
VKSEVDVGSQLIIATATATAVYCEAMPPPRVLEIARTIAVQDEEDHQLVKLQRLIETVSARNRQFLIASGERQTARTRKQVARKIKEAQLRKAAARLESEKRKATRRKGKMDSNHVLCTIEAPLLAVSPPPNVILRCINVRLAKEKLESPS